MSQDEFLWNPTAVARKEILAHLDLAPTFSRAFDLIRVNQENNGQDKLTISDKMELTLIELKTTKKALPKNPKGFFFGATKNEFDLADRLGCNYKFCFVSLNEETRSMAYLTLQDL